MLHLILFDVEERHFMIMVLAALQLLLKGPSCLETV
jgi:hypothetical protein